MNFSYSIDNHVQVYQDGNTFVNQFITEMNITVLLVCNNQDKSMLAFEKGNDGKYFKITKFDYLKDNIIPIGNNGDRWEGNSKSNIPYGFGKLYDCDGKLVYKRVSRRIETRRQE